MVGWGYTAATPAGATTQCISCRVPSVYPHSYCNLQYSHRATLLYETHVASQNHLDVYPGMAQFHLMELLPVSNQAPFYYKDFFSPVHKYHILPQPICPV